MYANLSTNAKFHPRRFPSFVVRELKLNNKKKNWREEDEDDEEAFAN